MDFGGGEIKEKRRYFEGTVNRFESTLYNHGLDRRKKELSVSLEI